MARSQNHPVTPPRSPSLRYGSPKAGQFLRVDVARSHIAPSSATGVGAGLARDSETADGSIDKFFAGKAGSHTRRRIGAIWSHDPDNPETRNQAALAAFAVSHRREKSIQSVASAP